VDNFFTLSSMTTLAGSVAVVVVVLNTTRHVLNWGPRWFGLLIAIAVSIGALHASSAAAATGGAAAAAPGLLGYIVALVNGCLIYTSAFGLQNSTIAPADAEAGSGIRFQSVVDKPGLPKEAPLHFRTPW